MTYAAWSMPDGGGPYGDSGPSMDRNGTTAGTMVAVSEVATIRRAPESRSMYASRSAGCMRSSGR
jgi:hypothetical protein